MIALDVMLFAVALTVVIEGSLSALFTSIRRAGRIWDIILINLLTNPLAQLFWITWDPNPEDPIYRVVLAIEIAVVCAEAVLLRRLGLARGWVGAVGLSGFLNAASAMAGFLWLIF